MNKLSYKEDGYAIVLLVDGEPICEKIGFDDKYITDGGIPVDLIEEEDEDIPLASSSWLDKEDFYMIGVCGCGEDGCSSTYCKIRKTKDSVEFYDFAYLVACDMKPPLPEIKFRFSRKNYDQVVKDLGKESQNIIKKIRAK